MSPTQAWLGRLKVNWHYSRFGAMGQLYAKNSSSFLAAVQIRCIAIWSAVLA